MSTSTYCPVSRTLGRHPEDLLPAIPYLLGYRPTDSLVCLFFDAGGGMRLSSRVDWETCRVAADDVAATLFQRACNSGAASVLVAAIDVRHPSPAVLAELGALFLDHGLMIDWAGECWGEHWRGLECTRDCAVHVLDRHCPTVLELITQGTAPAADRASIVAEVAAASNRLETIAPAGMPDQGEDREVWRDTAIEDCMALLAGHGRLSDADVAVVSATCLDIRVRDVVLWRLTVGGGGVNVSSPRTWDVFSQALRRAPDEAVAAVAAVAALVAWQMGEGTRAMECLKRATAADPDHSLAGLVFRCVDAAQPPSLWWQVMAGLDEETCRHGSRTHPQ